MKSETLRSLLVDKELGELTPDVVELLDAYLTAVPEAQAEADAMTRTVETARETVRRFPELAATPTTTATLRTEVIRHWFAPSLAYAAALIAVAGIAAWLGFPRRRLQAKCRYEGDSHSRPGSSLRRFVGPIPSCLRFSSWGVRRGATTMRIMS